MRFDGVHPGIRQPTFARLLRDAALEGWREFIRRNPDESPYAFAIIEGQSGNYLGYAVATEERLRRTAAAYEARGYRYIPLTRQEFDNHTMLAEWLRWANPDDGWFLGDFPVQFQIQHRLNELVGAG